MVLPPHHSLLWCMCASPGLPAVRLDCGHRASLPWLHWQDTMKDARAFGAQPTFAPLDSEAPLTAFNEKDIAYVDRCCRIVNKVRSPAAQGPRMRTWAAGNLACSPLLVCMLLSGGHAVSIHPHVWLQSTAPHGRRGDGSRLHHCQAVSERACAAVPPQKIWVDVVSTCHSVAVVLTPPPPHTHTVAVALATLQAGTARLARQLLL